LCTEWPAGQVMSEWRHRGRRRRRSLPLGAHAGP
jgi:hypothetical protein